MCFSAEASFTAGTMLIGAGGYCVLAAWRKRKALTPLALAPALFGMQQLAEGFVWLGLLHDEVALTRTGALWFLFFALAFWPFWIPLCAFSAETRPRWKLGLALFSIVGLVFGAALFLPILIDPERWL